MYYLEAGSDKNTRFRNAVALALAAHVALVSSIAFEWSGKSQYSPQIEVTLATRPSTYAPEDALLMAQANQEGSGDQSDINKITSRDSLQANTAEPQQALSQQRDNPTKPQQQALTTTAKAMDVASKELDDNKNTEPKLDGISPEVDRLNMELASLQAELDEQTQAYAKEPRVRRLTSASAKQSADAAYLLDWRQRLEAVGNKYYPEASVRYGIYGNVRLLVVIRHDGSLEDVKILSSSGYAVLDEAAIKVVRMAAPYSPFPPELQATTDKLEIIRTWHYLENQLSSRQ
jgi:protein TonB